LLRVALGRGVLLLVRVAAPLARGSPVRVLRSLLTVRSRLALWCLLTVRSRLALWCLLTVRSRLALRLGVPTLRPGWLLLIGRRLGRLPVRVRG